MFLIISTSLSPKSRSKILAQHVHESFKNSVADVEFVDLADLKLPRCDADTCYSNANVQQMCEKIKQAKGVVLATPIYNYSCCSELKNLIELTGQNWKDTLVGFLCAAGGQGSYMAIMGIANSLMLDFRSFILPRFVYATGAAFSGDGITDNDLLDRLGQFVAEHTDTTNRLFGP